MRFLPFLLALALASPGCASRDSTTALPTETGETKPDTSVPSPPAARPEKEPNSPAEPASSPKKAGEKTPPAAADSPQAAKTAKPNPVHGEEAGAAVPVNLLQASAEYTKARALYAKASRALRKGEKAEAELFLDQVLEVMPKHYAAAIAKARLCREDGRYHEALLVLEAARKHRPRNESLLYEQALAQAASGDPAAAAETLDQMATLGRVPPAARVLRARLLAAEDDREGTLAALEDAVDNGYLDGKHLATDSAFALVREDPRFQALLDRIRRERVEGAKRVKTALSPAKNPLTEGYCELDLPVIARDLQFRVQTGQGTQKSFDFQLLDGKPFHLSDHAGKVVIVEIWGTWSGLSTKELREVVRLHRDYRAKGETDAVFLALCHEPNADTEAARKGAAAYIRDFNLQIPCAYVDDGVIKDLQVNKFPTTIFIGRDGKAYMAAPGYKDYNALDKLTQVLLAYSTESPPEDATTRPPIPPSGAKTPGKGDGSPAGNEKPEGAATPR